MNRQRKGAAGTAISSSSGPYSMDIWDCLVVDDEQMLTESAEEYLNLLGVRAKGVLNAAASGSF